MLTTDYLIIGSGAFGMGFADQLLTETTADMIIVDRHHAPGGHWNDAYPFVRLHQPAAFYGVGSRPLGSDRIDEVGFNKGYCELPTGAEVCSHYASLMHERFLPSGRVRYFPMCDYLGDGRFRSMLSGEVHDVSFRRKLVDATWIKTEVPSTHRPSFEIADGVKLVTPNTLPQAAPAHADFVILGSGKTAMDVGIWLLLMGARPDRIRWFKSREAWLVNRDTTQPGAVFVERTAGGQALQLEAAAEAASIDDLFDRLERAGQLLRVDPLVRPTMFRGATISTTEIEMLRTIVNVERKGHVRRLEPGRVVLDQGAAECAKDVLYIDCTASAFGRPPLVPVFNGDRITIQMVRGGQMCLSASLIGHLEAAYEDEGEKNELCPPIPMPNSATDWAVFRLADLRSGRRWASDKALRRWMAEHRLGGVNAGVQGVEAERIGERQRIARPRAEENLARLLGEANQVQVSRS
jgi:hypothetical protein